jgi:hypothetical protein
MMMPVSLYQRTRVGGRAADQHAARCGNGEAGKGECRLLHVVSLLRKMVRRPLMPDLGAMAYIPARFRDSATMG